MRRQKSAFLVGLISLSLFVPLTAQITQLPPSSGGAPIGVSQRSANVNPLPATSTKDWGSTSEIIQAVASVANIVLVVWVFFFELRDERRSRSLASRRDTIAFRVRTLVLEPNIGMLHEFFELSENQLNESRAAMTRCAAASDLRNTAAENILAFKKRFRRVQDQIVEPLVLVSPAFSSLRSLMREIEDVVTNQLASALTTETEIEQCKIKIRSLRIEFIKVLFVSEDHALN